MIRGKETKTMRGVPYMSERPRLRANAKVSLHRSM